MSEKSKACSLCRKTKPLDEKHYHANVNAPDGFRSECRECRKLSRAERQRKRREAKLEEVEKGAVDIFVGAARVGGGNIPHSRELLEVMMEYFGGVRGYMNVFMKNLYDSPSGGSHRTKMLLSVMGLVTANTSMGGAVKPLEAMTEEELESEYRRRIMLEAAQMAKQMNVNGEPVKMIKSDDPDAIALPDPAEFEVVKRGKKEETSSGSAAADPDSDS